MMFIWRDGILASSTVALYYFKVLFETATAH
jgi:hypothetical protein